MGEWTWVPPRICLALMPQTDTWSLVTQITRTNPICPGNITSGIREVLHPSDGAHSWTLAACLMQMACTGKRREILTIIKARHVLLRTRTMSPMTPGMNRRTLIQGNTPLTSPHIPVGPRRWVWITAQTMKPVFPKGDRLYPPAIGTGANLLTPLGIAPSMPQLLLVGNIMGTKRDTILSLLRSLKVADIRMRAESERYLYTAMILFSSTAGLWMHGKIAAHNSVVRWWIES